MEEAGDQAKVTVNFITCFKQDSNLGSLAVVKVSDKNAVTNSETNWSNHGNPMTIPKSLLTKSRLKQDLNLGSLTVVRDSDKNGFDS